MKCNQSKIKVRHIEDIHASTMHRKERQINQCLNDEFDEADLTFLTIL